MSSPTHPISRGDASLLSTSLSVKISVNFDFSSNQNLVYAAMDSRLVGAFVCLYRTLTFQLPLLS